MSYQQTMLLLQGLFFLASRIHVQAFSTIGTPPARRKHQDNGVSSSRLFQSFFNQQQQQQQSSSSQTTDNAFLNSPRGDADTFLQWAIEVCGIQNNNYQISTSGGQSNWGAQTTDQCYQGDVVLSVPSACRLTSAQTRQDYPELFQQVIDPALGQQNDGQVYWSSHAALWLRVLQEYDNYYNNNGESDYGPWLEALPREFATAVELDDFETSCLPPFVKYLAEQDVAQYQEFVQSLRPQFSGILSDETLQDEAILKWAFNVVKTRARQSPTNDGEAEIIPLSDMMNHAWNANAEVQYDDEGNAHVVALQDLTANTALTKCYGQPTNPSRYMATYGFFDAAPPTTYGKFMPQLLEQDETLADLMAFYSGDYQNRLVFDVSQGDIAPDVWNLMLYRVLADNGDYDQVQTLAQALYNGDDATVAGLQEQYGAAAVQALHEHVTDVLSEIDECQEVMDEGGGLGLQHKHLPVIRRHNDFVKQVFAKVQWNLEQMM